MFNYQAPHMFADAYNLEYYIARTSSSTATGQGFGPNMFKLRQISIRRNGNGFTGGGSLNSLTNARSLKASCYSPTVPSSENGSAHYSSSEMVIRLPYTGRTGNISQATDSAGDAIYYYTFDMSDFLTNQLRKETNDTDLKMMLVPVSVNIATTEVSNSTYSAVKQLQTMSATQIQSALNGMEFEIVYSGFSLPSFTN